MGKNKLVEFMSIVFICIFMSFSWAQENFVRKEIMPQQNNMAIYAKEVAVPKSMYRVDFQADFNNEEVVLYVDGEKVFSKTISSSPVLGLADSMELKKKADTVKLTIVLPQKKEEWLCAIDLSKGVYIGIELTEEGLLVTQSINPYLYE